MLGASHLGYTFCERGHGSISIKNPSGEVEAFELLELVEFTSTRKRMSVVARHSDGRIRLYMKGADSVVLPLVKDADAEVMSSTIEQLERFASEGLRTLVIAVRNLSEEFFMQWSKSYKNALSNLDELAKHKAGLPNVIEELEAQLEQNVRLLGATAIEDRLQDGVPAAIRDLAAAGIRIWVLTGKCVRPAPCSLLVANNFVTNSRQRRNSHQCGICVPIAQQRYGTSDYRYGNASFGHVDQGNSCGKSL